jgi:hypothetical protein
MPARLRPYSWGKGKQRDAVSVDLGVTRIKGRTELSTFRIGNKDIWGLDLHHAGVFYEWDGQGAFGMIERLAVSKGRS